SVLPYGPTRRRDAGPSAALARGGLLSVIGTQWEWFSNRHSSRRLLFPVRLGKVCVRCGAYRFRRDGPSHDPLASAITAHSASRKFSFDNHQARTAGCSCCKEIMRLTTSEL